MQSPPPEPGHSIEFTMFMRAYQDMVFSTAARMAGNDAVAEDIAQEVFVRAYEHFAHLHGSPTAGGWLKTVATNLVLNHLTRHRRRWLDDSAALLELPMPDTVVADLSAEQRRTVIDAALRRLPDHQRLPLVLYHFEECTYEEIAAQLSVSLAKVKIDIHRGRAALLPMLTAAGISRHD